MPALFRILRIYVIADTRYWFYYTAVTALLFYAHYYAFLVILSQFVFLALMRLPTRQTSFLSMHSVDRRFFIPFLLSVATAAVLFAPWPLFVFDSLYGYKFTPEHFHGKLLLRFIHELGSRSYPLSFILILLAGLGVSKLKLEQKKGIWPFSYSGSCCLYL